MIAIFPCFCLELTIVSTKKKVTTIVNSQAKLNMGDLKSPLNLKCEYEYFV